MAEKIKRWEDKNDRFVAFLDIMGFKERLQRDGDDKVKKMLESLLPTIDYIETMTEYASTNTAGPAIKHIIFSDSIIVISSDKSQQAFNWIIFDTKLIIYNAIIQRIPIKGAIAFGVQTADFVRSLHFGQPLIDAFDLQNQLQLYGIVLHHTCERYLNDPDFIKKSGVKRLSDIDITNYLVPMKSGNINHYLVNWVSLYETNKRFMNEEKDPINDVSSLYNIVSGKPRIYVDNTLKYVRDITKRKSELDQKEEKKP